MNLRLLLFLCAGLVVGAIAFWIFGSPMPAPSDGPTETVAADTAGAEVPDAGIATIADTGPAPPGPAVRPPERVVAEPQTRVAPSTPQPATLAERAATTPVQGRDDNAAGAERGDTQFARFVALMDTRYASFRQGAEDCVEGLPSTLNARLEVRITRNDLGDPYEVRVTGAELPTEVVDCLTRKARAIELPQPYRADPYESENYDVDSQTDSEFDWVTRLQLGG